MISDYLTRGAQMPPYLIFPRLLFDADLLPASIFVYMLLEATLPLAKLSAPKGADGPARIKDSGWTTRDRARLSLSHEGWTDAEGRAFIIYTVDDLAAALHRTEKTIRLALNALVEKGLIEKVHQGVGKADYIYVKVPREGAESAQQPGGSPLPPNQAEPVADDRRQRYPITADDGIALPPIAVIDDRPGWKQITGDGGNPLPGSKNYARGKAKGGGNREPQTGVLSGQAIAGIHLCERQGL